MSPLLVFYFGLVNFLLHVILKKNEAYSISKLKILGALFKTK